MFTKRNSIKNNSRGLKRVHFESSIMIAPSGEQIDDERRSFFKYFITLLFLFIIMMLLRKEKEEEDEISSRAKLNLRQSENYRNFAFNFLREISYLKYDSVIYISPNRKILPSIKYIDDYTVHVEGYDDILRNFQNLSLAIHQVNHNFYIHASEGNKKENYICIKHSYSDDSCATINTILVDRFLFKNLQISSCTEKDDTFCFFIFVQLKKNKCYNFNNLSYSCHLNNTVKKPNVFLLNNYCYVLVASSKVEKIYEFIQLHLLSSGTFNEHTRTKEVEIVTHFCGNLLNQVATIDASNGRLLFIQQYIRANGKNGDPQWEENVRGEHTRGKLNKDNTKNVEDKRNEAHQWDAKKESNSSSLNFHISYYLTIINLTSENRDIIEYVEYMKSKQEFNLFPPIYIAFDEQTNFYYIVQHEKDGHLNFIFISPTKMQVYYTLKIREFYSGWLLNAGHEYDSKGEYPPYEDELHIWDIINMQHRKYLVNVIKTY
ncbi:hypothetical protein POVCU1_037780 [Plasmodium ovale curtisi]|uniref:Uncharacterized protein n=1 Tax=Plasmodium ovale curtisi TaxID=864141 RepID=A0A1A8WWP4_PLAOA|nr:hypothetical protein POVCU1_037780 [Plasmodium ovale curtisi]